MTDAIKHFEQQISSTLFCLVSCSSINQVLISYRGKKKKKTSDLPKFDTSDCCSQKKKKNAFRSGLPICHKL